MSNSGSNNGPGILGIALAVALGIGIAHDDGWIGGEKEDAPTQETTTKAGQAADDIRGGLNAPGAAPN